MALQKPSQLFESKEIQEENSSPARQYLNDTYKQFQGSLFKIEELQERVEEIYNEYPKTFELLANEVNQRVTKDDLDNTMFTHLTVVDENFKAIKEQVKGVNKKDLRDFKDNVNQLTEIVNDLVDVELPQYKNRVTGSEVKVSEKLSENEKKVTDQLNKFSDFIKNEFNRFDTDFKLTKEDVLETSETYKKLHLVVENKYLEENKKLEEYSNILEDFNERVNSFRDEVTFKIDEYEKYVFTKRDSISKDIKEFKKEVKSDVSDVKADILRYENHLDNYIKKDVRDLKEEVIDDVSRLLKGDILLNVGRLEKKIEDIREKYDAIKPDEIMQDIQEGLVNIPPNEKNSDPLTPLDQNFVTTQQLQDHYRLFLNRIQQQLATLGGGGETQLKYLDDIVGIATNASAYDGKFLKYNHTTGKFEFADAAGGSGAMTKDAQENLIAGDGAGAQLAVYSSKNILIGDQSGNDLMSGQDNVSLGANSLEKLTSGADNVAIGRQSGRYYGTNSERNTLLGAGAGWYGNGNGAFSRNTFIGWAAGSQIAGNENVIIGYNRGATVSPGFGDNKLIIGAGSTDWITGSSNYDVGIGTDNPRFKMHVVGSASTTLMVEGNARVTGILTIGTGSITLDPTQSQIQLGNTMLRTDHSTGNIDVMDHNGSYKEIRVKGGDAASKNDAIAFAIALG